MTFSYQTYLARWARRLSWKETADIFETSWDKVFRAVKSVVDYHGKFVLHSIMSNQQRKNFSSS
jgi:hypothetical protein